MPDVVIVGGGVVGLATAFHLGKRGIRDVTLLERRYLGAGASGKSGAIVRTHYSNEPETRLAIEGLHTFQNWDEIVGGDCGFTRTGIFVIAPPESRADLEANVAMQRSLGVNVEIVDRAQAQELDPALSLDDGAVAAFEFEAGVADSMATCNSLAAAVQRMGVTIRIETAVTAIRHESGRVIGVETSAGPLDAGSVVVAPGAFAHTLLRPLGIDLPMEPATSRIAIFRWPLERDPRHPVLLDNMNGLWLRPIYGDSTLIGAERGVRRVVDDPEGAEETIDQAYVDHCRRQLAKRYPVMRHAVSRGGWTGILMRAVDDRPIIGPFDGYAGLIGLVGDSGTSFKTAPAVGRALAELVVDGRSETDLTPFHASRFRGDGRWVDEHQYSVDGIDLAVTANRAARSALHPLNLYPVLANPDYRRLWLGLVPYQFAFQMSVVTTGFAAVTLADSALEVGIVVGAWGLPVLFVPPWEASRPTNSRGAGPSCWPRSPWASPCSPWACSRSGASSPRGTWSSSAWSRARRSPSLPRLEPPTRQPRSKTTSSRTRSRPTASASTRRRSSGPWSAGFCWRSRASGSAGPT